MENNTDIVEEAKKIINHSRGGTSNYWSTMMRDYVMTDGVIAVCDTVKCHWLVDAILSHQTNPQVMAELMQFWKLEEGHQPPEQEGALLTCTDGDKGSGRVELARQTIEYTDFPKELMPFEIWVSNKVLLLPQEY